MENYTKYYSPLFSWIDMRIEESLYLARRLEALEAKRTSKLYDQIWSTIVGEE